jgi:uncharacterized protein
MLPEIQSLLILQDRDQKIRKLRQDLKKGPEDEAMARTRLAGDEAAVKAAKEADSLNEIAIKKVELDIGTRRTTISRMKQQQFETRKNEEFRALDNEITRYNSDVAKLEDEQLVLMEKGEALKARLAAANDSLKATRAQVDDEITKIAQRLEAAKGKIIELEADRAQLATGIESGALARYDRLFVNKSTAVVPLNNGICGGCHMKLTPMTVGAVKLEKVLTYCEQCGRMLYRGED